mmetsp:Transcript_24055/g.50370  ORF Transcript_24055/g.50370 Transcript_24055/m.50370 type:complete len:236 (+) Transcript_24055:38-745(+)
MFAIRRSSRFVTSINTTVLGARETVNQSSRNLSSPPVLLQIQIRDERKNQQLLSSFSFSTAADPVYDDESPPIFSNLQEEIDDANERYRENLAIRDTNDIRGRGVFSLRPFKTGAMVMSSLVLSTQSERSQYTLQKDWDLHVNLDLPSRFVNHSCDANIGVRDNDDGGYDFYAMKEIKEGEELVWDYEMTEWEVGSMDDCLCGAERCRKKFGGFKKSGDVIKKNYGEFFADYLKK